MDDRQAPGARRAPPAELAWQEAFELGAEDPERDPELAGALRAPAATQRLIVFLRYFADLDYGEIARSARSTRARWAPRSPPRTHLPRALETEEVGQELTRRRRARARLRAWPKPGRPTGEMSSRGGPSNTRAVPAPPLPDRRSLPVRPCWRGRGGGGSGLARARPAVPLGVRPGRSRPALRSPTSRATASLSPGRTPIRLATAAAGAADGELRSTRLQRPTAGASSTTGGSTGSRSGGSQQAQLRIVDTRSGIDRLLARGAQSFAWADRLAFVVGWRVIVRERPFDPRDRVDAEHRLLPRSRPGGRSAARGGRPMPADAVRRRPRASRLRAGSAGPDAPAVDRQRGSRQPGWPVRDRHALAGRRTGQPVLDRARRLGAHWADRQLDRPRASRRTGARRRAEQHRGVAQERDRGGLRASAPRARLSSCVSRTADCASSACCGSITQASRARSSSPTRPFSAAAHAACSSPSRVRATAAVTCSPRSPATSRAATVSRGARSLGAAGRPSSRTRAAPRRG